jgi:predicted nucleic acid-binding protein
VELLSTIGKAVPNQRIQAEEREADLWFELKPKTKGKRQDLGLLGKLLTHDALIEVFRNAATAIVYQLTLVTRNGGDFNKINGLNLLDPFV